jgi:hypothetical protein
VLEVAGIAWRHASIDDIVAVVLVSQWLLALALFALWAFSGRVRPEEVPLAAV